jgi:hypothetical protein
MTVDQWVKLLVVIPFLATSGLFSLRDDVGNAQLCALWAIALAVAMP